MKHKFSRYNDGVVSIYKAKPRNSSFRANLNVTGLEDLDFVVKLSFEQASRREKDMEFAEQSGHSLSMKVKTHKVGGVKTGCKAIIGETLYNIYDMDSNRTEMWLYLERVREVSVNGSGNAEIKTAGN